MRITQIRIRHFCGFEDFTLDVGDLTVLVGPNNGGKTTVLRAIKFAFDSFRMCFGDGEQPNKRRPQDRPHIGTPGAGARIGAQEPLDLYFGRNRDEAAVITLAGQTPLGDASFTVECAPAQNDVVPSAVLCGTEWRELKEDQAWELTRDIYFTGVEYVPMMGGIGAVEQQLSYPELQDRLRKGQVLETFRNRLQWLNEGKDPELFSRVVNRVRSYVGNVQVRPPARTTDQPSNVRISYLEEGVEHEVAAAGGGLRTLLAIAAAIELSTAKIHLFDEPDAHLDPTFQRQVARFLADQAGTDRQVLVATHAPDFIDEMPVESLVWIDRKARKGRACDSLGQVLVNLGCLSQSQAIREVGADVVLFFEDKPDRRILSRLMKRCGKSALIDRSRLALLKGAGDARYVGGVARVLREALRCRIAVGVIRDSDYSAAEPNSDEDDNVAMLRIPCKELENLVLDGQTINAAAASVAEKREREVERDVPHPTADEINSKIDELSKSDEVRQPLYSAWLARWLDRSNARDAGAIAKAEREFEGLFADPSWRRKHCSGKKILRKLRRWLQETYDLTLTDDVLFGAYEPDNTVKSLFNKLQAHIDKYLGKPV